MPSISLTNLISYWALDEASGTRFDSHGSKPMGDVNGVGSATGKVATAADFEASSTQCLSGAFIDVVNEWSTTLWFNAESFPADYQGLFTRDDFGSPRHQTSIYINASSKLAVYTAPGGSNFDGTGSTTFSTATWYFIAVTYTSANGLKGYVNATSEASAAGIGTLGTGNAPVEIGRDVFNSLRYFDGLIDEVSLWQRELTASEITWLYNSGAGRSYSDIVTEANGAAKRYLLVRN